MENSKHLFENFIRTLEPELGELVRRKIEPDETVVWMGQPRVDLFRREIGMKFLIVGLIQTIFYLGFICFIAIQIDPGKWSGRKLLLIGVLLMGLLGMLFLAASPLRYRKLAKLCCYVLTDRRAIIIQKNFFRGPTIESYGPAALTSILRRENNDGSGSLVFLREADSRGSKTNTIDHGFMDMDNIGPVEKLIQETLLQAN